MSKTKTMSRIETVAEKEEIEESELIDQIKSTLNETVTLATKYQEAAKAKNGLEKALIETKERADRALKCPSADDAKACQEILYSETLVRVIDARIVSAATVLQEIERQLFDNIRSLQSVVNEAARDFIDLLRRREYHRIATALEVDPNEYWPDESAMAKAKDCDFINELEYELKVHHWEFHEQKDATQLVAELKLIGANYSKLREAIKANRETLENIPDWPQGYYWKPPKQGLPPDYPPGGGSGPNVVVKDGTNDTGALNYSRSYGD